MDEISNLICQASATHYQDDPVKTTIVNVHGSIDILGLSKRVKAKYFASIYIRSIYGSNGPSSARNMLGNTNPIRIRAYCDEGKQCAKTPFNYHRQHPFIKDKSGRDL